jgi:hypothetical protein
MTFYVYSTLTCDNHFTIYANNSNRDLPVIERSILIKGGHNVATKHLYTPKGVMTEVSDEDMAVLQEDYHFKEQMKHGFITIERKKVEPEKVAKDMTDRDGSSPKTPEDYEKGENSTASTPVYKTKGKNK